MGRLKLSWPFVTTIGGQGVNES